ncbi:hypothetical protein ABK040_011335 [Willaertia magna]
MSSFQNLAKVFVSGVGYKTSWQSLKNHFSNAGLNVAFVKIFTDYETKRSKGMGIVSFNNQEDAKKAIELLNGSELEGRNINVREFKEREPQQQTTEEQH